MNNPSNRQTREGEPLSLPTRKHPAHGINFAPDKPTIIFVTVCTKDRQPWLASPPVHALLRQVWTAAGAWLVGEYVIMPDHIHLFASPGPRREGEAPAEPPCLDNWVRYWKSQFTKRHGDASHRWQPDHWDRRLRSHESYADKWDYIRNNPVRHVLVAAAIEWPHQGKLHDLSW